MVAFSTPGQRSELVSPPITCAHGGRFALTYLTSPGASLRLCADERCVVSSTLFFWILFIVIESEWSSKHPNYDLSHIFNNHFLQAQRTAAGELAVNLTSTRPFHIRVVVEAAAESYVILKNIHVGDEGFCPLESPTQLACRSLKCEFRRELHKNKQHA